MKGARNDRRVRLGRQGLVWPPRGDELPILAAAIEPWRIRPNDHASILDNLKALGLPALELRIPWRIYQDLASSSTQDLFALLRACHERHLAVFVHLGPLSDVVDGGGLPRDVATADDVGARGPRGEALVVPRAPRPFIQPSLASTHFLDRATTWLGDAARTLEPFAHPRGPIIAAILQTRPDLFGRRGAYDGDYHPDALSRYHRWLEARYGGSLPRGYPSAVITDVAPPRRFDATHDDELLWHVDWIAFGESLVVEAVAQFTTTLRDHGLDAIALLHRQPTGSTATGDDAPLDAIAAHTDGAGVVLTELRTDLVRRRIQLERLAGHGDPALILQHPWGAPAQWIPPTGAQEETLLLLSLMYGAQGILIDGLVGVDERVGAPLDGDGQPRRGAAFERIRRLLAMLTHLDLYRRPRNVEVGLVEPRHLARLARARSMLDPLPPGLLALVGLDVERLGDPFSPGAEVVTTTTVLRETLAKTLDRANIPFVRVDGEDPRTLARLSTLLLPLTSAREALIDDTLRASLDTFVTSGGRLILVGSEDPAWLPPHTHVKDPHDLPATLLAAGVCPSPLAVERQDHRGVLLPATTRVAPGDDEPILFVANPEDKEVHGRLITPAARCRDTSSKEETPPSKEETTWSLWDALSGVPVDRDAIAIPAASLRILRCRKPKAPSPHATKKTP